MPAKQLSFSGEVIMSQPFSESRLLPWTPEMSATPFKGTAIIRESHFPRQYDAREMFVMSDHHRMMEMRDRNSMRTTIMKHFGHNFHGFQHGSMAEVPDARMLAFLKELLGADAHYPGLKWVGFAVVMRHNVPVTRSDSDGIDVEYYLIADRRGVSVPVVKVDAL